VAVTPDPVVAVEPGVEDLAGLTFGGQGDPVDQLALEGRKKRFGYRVGPRCRLRLMGMVSSELFG
jgi:hypothetical protein